MIQLQHLQRKLSCSLLTAAGFAFSTSSVIFARLDVAAFPMIANKARAPSTELNNDEGELKMMLLILDNAIILFPPRNATREVGTELPIRAVRESLRIKVCLFTDA
jgi:hypothetical protein